MATQDAPTVELTEFSFLSLLVDEDLPLAIDRNRSRLTIPEKIFRRGNLDSEKVSQPFAGGRDFCA